MPRAARDWPGRKEKDRAAGEVKERIALALEKTVHKSMWFTVEQRD